MEKRIERAHAIGAGILVRTDLAAEAAAPRKEPAPHHPGRALISLSLPHRSLSAAPEYAIPCPAPPGRADCAEPGPEPGLGEEDELDPPPVAPWFRTVAASPSRGRHSSEGEPGAGETCQGRSGQVARLRCEET